MGQIPQLRTLAGLQSFLLQECAPSTVGNERPPAFRSICYAYFFHAKSSFLGKKSVRKIQDVVLPQEIGTKVAIYYTN
jgi:hypothetical protein